MDKIKVIYDTVGHTLTVWLDDPAREHVCEETNDEVVVMKDVDNRVIGFEVLHVERGLSINDLEVETFLQMQGYLTPTTVNAVRLIDDENDIFSKTRCDLLSDVTKSLPTVPAAVDKFVRDLLSKKLGLYSEPTPASDAIVTSIDTSCNGFAENFSVFSG